MIINNIDTKDISFIVQGAIDTINTPKCLRSIRENFPGSTIVLSTWKKAKVKNLTYDFLVENIDPGACSYDSYGTLNNINRQLLSTLNGLQVVKTKYAAKVRSDLIFDGVNFLYYFNKFPKCDQDYKAVASKMITLSMYSRRLHIDTKNGIVLNLPFYFSDWFLFGYTDDLLNFYNTQTISDLSTFSTFYLKQDAHDPGFTFTGYWAKEAPENYFVENFFSRFLGKKVYTSRFDCSKETMDLSRRLIANNIVILNYEQSKIYSGKWEHISRDEWSLSPVDAIALTFYCDFLYDYKKYCDSSFNIPQEFVYERKKKIKNLFRFLISSHILNQLRLILSKPKKWVKKILYAILPSYRVACGIRDKLEFHIAEESRINSMLYQTNMLIQKSTETMLDKLIEAKEELNNVTDIS